MPKPTRWPAKLTSTKHDTAGKVVSMLCLYAHCLSGCHTYSPGVQPSELARTACVCQDSGTATCLGRVARCVQEQTQRSARKSDRQVLSHWFARRQSLRHKHKASLVSSVKRRDEEGNLGRRHFMACTASLTVLWTSGFGFASLSFHIFFFSPMGTPPLPVLGKR